jgi:hypothetical protein
MQSWQIKALELEVSALNHLDGFIHEHALYFLIGAIYLLLALLAWVLSGGLRRKGGKLMSCVRPAIVIRLPGPLPPDTFDPFPPPHHPVYDDHRDDYAE